MNLKEGCWVDWQIASFVENLIFSFRAITSLSFALSTNCPRGLVVQTLVPLPIVIIFGIFPEAKVTL